MIKRQGQLGLDYTGQYWYSIRAPCTRVIIIIMVLFPKHQSCINKICTHGKIYKNYNRHFWYLQPIASRIKDILTYVCTLYVCTLKIIAWQQSMYDVILNAQSSDKKWKNSRLVWDANLKLKVMYGKKDIATFWLIAKIRLGSQNSNVHVLSSDSESRNIELAIEE